MRLSFSLLMSLLAALLAAHAEAQPISSQDQFVDAVSVLATDLELSRLIATYPQFATSSVAASLREQGSNWLDRGDYPKALPLLRAAAEIFRASGDQAGLANALNGIGIVYGAQGRYADAQSHFQRSLDLWVTLGDDERLMSVSTNIGNVFRWQRNFEQALAIHRGVLTLAHKRRDDKYVGTATLNIAFVLVDKGDFNGASDHFVRAIDIGETLNASWLPTAFSGIGNLRTDQGRHVEASRYHARALEILRTGSDRRSIAFTLGSLAWLSNRTGHFEDAIQQATEAAILATDLGLQETLWRVLFTLGSSYLARGELTLAKDAFDRSVATIEAMRRDLVGSEREQEPFFSDKLYPYEGLVSLMLRRNRPVTALAYAEQAKARILLDVSRAGRVALQQAMTPQERVREGDLKNRLAVLNAELRRLNAGKSTLETRTGPLHVRREHARLAYEQFQMGLYARRPELRLQLGRFPWRGPGAIASLLDTDTAVLEYVVTDETTHVFLLARDEQGTARVRAWNVPITSTDLRKRVDEMRRMLGDRDGRVRERAVELYDLLIRPASALLQRMTTLVVVPDKVLWELPFQALHSGRSYLLEDFALLYAPSMTVLADARRVSTLRSPTARVLAVGNPATGRDPLPNAEREAEGIANLHGRDKSLVLIGADAREREIKRRMPGYDVLHFASHGVRDDHDPMHSHVVLASPERDEAEDGLLEARELVELKLRARLVVMSACESALGRVSDGEGTIGMTWAVFVAGSRTVVASQWKVDSASTSELMLEFHRGVAAAPESLNSSLAVARLLRGAALSVKNSPSPTHPFYWAGFAALGTRP